MSDQVQPRRPEWDPAIVRRLSALSEEYAIAYFWMVAGRAEDRLNLLLLMTQVVIERPPTWDRAAIRRQHEDQMRARAVSLRRSDAENLECFSCRNRGVKLYFHHVIEVQNGGSNASRNRVPLCFDCHQYLHPWLKEQTKRDATDFYSVREVAAATAETLERFTAAIDEVITDSARHARVEAERFS